LCLDFVDLIQPALPAARTDFTRTSPGGFTFQIGIPKRPRSALERAIGVDRAFSGDIVEEHTITVGKFAETLAGMNLSDVSALEFLDRQ
jgi:hypothetical protein